MYNINPLLFHSSALWTIDLCFTAQPSCQDRPTRPSSSSVFPSRIRFRRLRPLINYCQINKFGMVCLAKFRGAPFPTYCWGAGQSTLLLNNVRDNYQSGSVSFISQIPKQCSESDPVSQWQKICFSFRLPVLSGTHGCSSAREYANWNISDGQQQSWMTSAAIPWPMANDYLQGTSPTDESSVHWKSSAEKY